MVAAGLLLATLASLALGSPIKNKSGMRVLGRRDSPPSGFSWTSLATPDTVLSLKFALAQSDPAGLEQALYDVSDPKSANYGQHLTKEEVSSLRCIPSYSLLIADVAGCCVRRTFECDRRDHQ